MEGEMLLEFADAMDLALSNTWFKKEESKLVTYESGGCRTVVDYILVCKSERKMMRNVTVMPGVSCLLQHKLLVCILEASESRKEKKVFVSRCKVWKLKEESVWGMFQARLEEGLAESVVV